MNFNIPPFYREQPPPGPGGDGEEGAELPKGKFGNWGENNPKPLPISPSEHMTAPLQSQNREGSFHTGHPAAPAGDAGTPGAAEAERGGGAAPDPGTGPGRRESAEEAPPGPAGRPPAPEAAHPPAPGWRTGPSRPPPGSAPGWARPALLGSAGGSAGPPGKRGKGEGR